MRKVTGVNRTHSLYKAREFRFKLNGIEMEYREMPWVTNPNDHWRWQVGFYTHSDLLYLYVKQKIRIFFSSSLHMFEIWVESTEQKKLLSKHIMPNDKNYLPPFK